jgi:hypothetical protein
VIASVESGWIRLYRRTPMHCATAETNETDRKEEYTRPRVSLRPFCAKRESALQSWWGVFCLTLFTIALIAVGSSMEISWLTSLSLPQQRAPQFMRSAVAGSQPPLRPLACWPGLGSMNQALRQSPISLGIYIASLPSRSAGFAVWSVSRFYVRVSPAHRSVHTCRKLEGIGFRDES